MQKVRLFDTIHVEITDIPGISLGCAGSDLPENEDNLLWKAAALFLHRSVKAKGRGVNIQLEKRIPVSAGLGGGSSNCGSLLRGLNRFFDNEFSSAELIAMGATLGADVPFFCIEDKGVIATGIGEIMEPVDVLENCTFVLVNPGVKISTAEIFRKYSLTITNKNSRLTGSRKLQPEQLGIASIENDLELITVAEFPVIAEIKDELRKLGAAGALMSGSGSTVFGIFHHGTSDWEVLVEQAVKRLRSRFGKKIYIA